MSPASSTLPTLRADDVRRVFLRAQGLLGPPPGGRPVARVEAVLRALGGVQLDTISVLARSHELVAYSRLGAVGREAVEAAYWGRGRAFEYWGHAACVLPLEWWPWFAIKRRRYRDRSVWMRQPEPRARAEVLARLRDLGPLTATDLGGSRNGKVGVEAKGVEGWWDWSPLKVAVEQLLAEGEVACLERRGWRRVYDLASRAVPPALRTAEPSDEECAAHLCAEAALRLGAATAAELADYFRLRAAAVAMGIAAAGLVPVAVEGWGQRAYAHPALLDALVAPRRGRHRTTLLSPFDSLVRDRRRTERVFDFTHRLEAYVPRAKRVHGYFTMPLLAGGRLRGRVDPGRSGRTLVARRVALEAAAVEAMAAALVEAAGWVGCDAVAVEAVDPAALRRPLEAALRRVA